MSSDESLQERSKLTLFPCGVVCGFATLETCPNVTRQTQGRC